MNESHHIDDLFRDKLGEFELAPPMHLFDAIDEKRRKPKGFWFWLKNDNSGNILLGASALILAGLLAFFLFNKTQTVRLNSFPVELKDNPAISQQEATSAADAASEELSNEALIESNTNSLSVNENIEAETSSLQKNKAPLNPSKSSRGKSLSDKQQDLMVENKLNAELPINSISSEDKDLNKQEKIEQLTNPVISDLNSEEIIDNSERSIFEAFSSLPISPAAELEQQIVTTTTLPTSIYRSGNGINYYMEVLGGPVFASRTLNPITEDFTSIVRERNQAENSSFSSSFGLRMAFVNRKGWSLRTGIQFTQIRESFNYINRFPEVSQILDPGGGGLVLDTVFIQQGPAINQSNQYNLIDIPVIIGFEKRFKRWTFSAHGGPRFNIGLQQEGLLINENLQAVSFASEEGQQAFRNTLGISWYASLGLQFELSPGIHLLLEPNFSFGQGSITRTPYQVQQRYFNSGLAVGVRKLVW